jgi:Flp pilus assembly protein CpaB
MKRRSWLWFVASAILAILAGVLAIWIINQNRNQPVQEIPEYQVVVASAPISANETIGPDKVRVEARTEPVTGQVLEQDIGLVLGSYALRDIAPGEIITTQDFYSIETGGMTGVMRITSVLEDKFAVTLPADDILSNWGAVLPGDHVDVLITFDVILETPMYPADVVARGEQLVGIDRDERMDNVSALTLQNLEVLQILQEPQPEQQEEGVAPARRALVLKIDPQDAVVLKYLQDSDATIDLALRNPENSTLYSVEPVNINYLVLRYNIALPEPLE